MHRESCRQDVRLKGDIVITLKCTLTLDSRELHNLICRVLFFFIMIYGYALLIHVMLSYRKHSLAHDDAVFQVCFLFTIGNLYGYSFQHLANSTASIHSLTAAGGMRTETGRFSEDDQGKHAPYAKGH